MKVWWKVGWLKWKVWFKSVQLHIRALKSDTIDNLWMISKLYKNEYWVDIYTAMIHVYDKLDLHDNMQ